MDFTSLKVRLETVKIRVRAWLTTVINLATIGLFLLGVGAVWQVQNVEINPIGPVTYLGYEIPAVAGFSPVKVKLYGGILVMMVGLGLAYRRIVSDTYAQPHY